MLHFGCYRDVRSLIACLRNATNIRNLRGRLQGIRKEYKGQFCDVYRHESVFVVDKFGFCNSFKGFAKSEIHVDLHGLVILQDFCA